MRRLLQMNHVPLPQQRPGNPKISLFFLGIILGFVMHHFIISFQNEDFWRFFLHKIYFKLRVYSHMISNYDAFFTSDSLG